MISNAERSKLYRERNPETFRESLKRYWKKPHICDCGAIITNGAKSLHLKSKKHCTNLAFLERMGCKKVSV